MILKFSLERPPVRRLRKEVMLRSLSSASRFRLGFVTSVRLLILGLVEVPLNMFST